MTTYSSSIPQPTDFLSKSQQDILNNFGSANTSFGIDHYPFDDSTANNGKHNTVTTPIIIGASPPTTAANEPKFYALQQYPAIGVLQYSRGPSNAPPTPLTTIHSQSTKIILTPGSTTDIIDFNGMTRVYCDIFIAYNILTTPTNTIGFTKCGCYFNSALTDFIVIDNYAFTGPNGVGVLISGTKIQVELQTGSPNKNAEVFWTLQFWRIV